MLNAADHKTRPKSPGQTEKPYKKGVILKITMEKLCMIIDILM